MHSDSGTDFPAAAPAAARPRRGGSAGFTLLELVAVIGIIAIMSAIVLGGFNGMLRAISEDTGASALRRSCNLAWQQALVDGNDVFVWVTGVDSYVIVRRAGTVTDFNDGSRSYSWGDGQSLDNLADGRARWVFDDYADLGNVGVSFAFNDDDTEASVREVFDQYKGLLAFDLDAKVLANVIVPPMHDKSADAWVFGVDKSSAGSGGFKTGHDYGWLVVPEQYLPKGYVFDGTFNQNDGAWNGAVKYIRYPGDGGTPDGPLENEITIVETATGKTFSVKPPPKK